MVKHYLKIALRSIAKQQVLAFINVAGLSIGFAFFILFLLYAVNEFSFDRFHKNASNIYRVYRHIEAMQSDPVQEDIYLPMPLGPALKQEVPDVQDFVRIQEASDESYVKFDDKIDRIRVSFADPQFFRMFSFKLKSG